MTAPILLLEREISIIPVAADMVIVDSVSPLSATGKLNDQGNFTIIWYLHNVPMVCQFKLCIN